MRATADVRALLVPGSVATITQGDNVQRVTLVRVTENAGGADLPPLQLLPPGYRYVAVEYRIENLTGREQPLGLWEAQTADGIWALQNLDTGFSGGTGDARIGANGRLGGIVIFRVPLNAPLRSVRYVPSRDISGAIYFGT